MRRGKQAVAEEYEKNTLTRVAMCQQLITIYCCSTCVQSYILYLLTHTHTHTHTHTARAPVSCYVNTCVRPLVCSDSQIRAHARIAVCIPIRPVTVHLARRGFQDCVMYCLQVWCTLLYCNHDCCHALFNYKNHLQ